MLIFTKVRNTTVETHISINIENDKNTSSLIFEFLHFGNPYPTMSNICYDQTINQDFIMRMSCREEEVQLFLLSYYNSKAVLKYSVLNQLCGVRPSDVDEKVEEWSCYNYFCFFDHILFLWLYIVFGGIFVFYKQHFQSM